MMAKWVITVAGDAGMAALFYFGIVQGVPGARNLYLFIEWSLALFIFFVYFLITITREKLKPRAHDSFGSFSLLVFENASILGFVFALAWQGFTVLASIKLLSFAMYRALPWSKDKESEGV